LCLIEANLYKIISLNLWIIFYKEYNENKHLMKKPLLFLVFSFTFLISVFAQNNTDCAFLDAGEDDEVGCAGGPCTELTAAVNFDLLGGGDDTSSYIVGPVNCPLDVQPGSPVSVNIDDRWSSVIDMTFDFSFFGNTYNQILIGSNGVLTFDIADADGYCPWSFSDSAPSSNLITNAIFGAYHDIDPSVCGQIEYYITGTAPFRAFVVNFNQICHFSSSCHDLQTSQHIILYETSNIIDIYIDDKPTCTSWNSGNALLGIQNESGTLAYIAPGRNTGPWTATDEQWRFVPDDNFIIDSVLTWYDDAGSVVSNELNVWVCPEETTTYTAELAYNLNGTDYVITDDVTITVNGISTVEAFEPEDMEECATLGFATFDLTSTIPTVIGSQTDVTVSFFETEQDADDFTNEIVDPENYNTSIFTTIWVRVSDNTPPCYALTNFNVNPIIITFELASDIEECSVYPNSLEGEFDLNPAGAQITTGHPNLTVSYYLTSDDATNQTNEITQIASYISETTIIWVRVEDSTVPECFVLTSFDIIVRPTPAIVQPPSLELCSIIPGDEFASFDLESQTSIIDNGQVGVTVTYHETLADADAAINTLTSPYTNLSNPQTIYARLSNTDGCYNTTTFDLLVHVTPIANEPMALETCSMDQGGDSGTFELTNATQDVINGQQDVTVTYYATEADAMTGTNVLTNTTYTGVSTTFFIRIESSFGCFSTTSVDVLVNETPIANQPSNLKECNEGDGYAIYNLQAQVDNVLDGQTNVDVTFYTSQADADYGTNEILSDIDAYNTLAGIIYIRVENRDSGCYSLTSFELFVENCIPDLPNAFSPNADGMNDVFSIQRLENVFYDYTMTIYNRWGSVVFEGNRDKGFWDGSVDGVISTDPTGTTYFYVLDFNDGETESLNGWIYVQP
jgi:gliding motility-associated-like protein